MTGLPEEEKAVLRASVLSLQGELHVISQGILEARNKVSKLYSHVEIQQRLPAPAILQEQLNDITHELDATYDKMLALQEHASKARQVVDAIMKGVFD